MKSYRSALKHAQEPDDNFCQLFFAGRNERRLLRNASRRGVDIRIVLSAESDEPLVKRATNFLYDFILRNNISIYEYLPSNLHAKVATVDGNWSTIGSYNMNHLSDYGSVEMNADILDLSSANNLRGFFWISLRTTAGRLHLRNISGAKHGCSSLPTGFHTR